MQHTEVPAGHIATAAAAVRLGVSKQTVRRYAAGGALASVVVNGGMYVSASDVTRLIDQRVNGSAS